MFFPSCIYSFLQIEELQILQDLSTNIQFVKHFRHQERLEGEDEYYLTTLESVVEFIHGLSHVDLKVEQQEYARLVQKAVESMESEKQAKEEAAKVELMDLLEMNNAEPSTKASQASQSVDLLDVQSQSSQSKGKSRRPQDNDDMVIKKVGGGKGAQVERLDKLDMVYNEMKHKNKALKKQMLEKNRENETLRQILADFEAQFKQNRKDEKLFEELTMGDVEEIFALQQKLVAQIQSMKAPEGS